MDLRDYNQDDPERHRKRLQAVMDVSQKIQMLAMKRRSTVRLETREEQLARIMVRL